MRNNVNGRKNVRKSVASRLMMGVAGAVISTFFATQSEAAVVDVVFPITSWNLGLNGQTGVPPQVPGIQGFGFSFGGFDLGFTGGFFHNQSFSSGLGLAAYSTTPTTFGPSLPSGISTGQAYFFSSSTPGLTVNEDATGYLGFLSSAGNYGYVEFDWDRSAASMTILSAKVETEVGKAISVAPVPLPAALPMLLAGFGGLALLRRRRRSA